MPDELNEFIEGADYFGPEIDDDSLLDPDMGAEMESVLLGVGTFVVFVVVLIGGLMFMQARHDASHATPSAPTLTSVPAPEQEDSPHVPDPPCYPFQHRCGSADPDV